MPTEPGGDDLWIRRFHQTGASGPRLICFPHAGGSASYFHSLSQSLAPGIEVLAVQYPGRQDRRRETCAGNIADLADGVFAALRGCDDRPMALFGHSMGAVVAFEVGLRLQRQKGAPPLHLFASGRRAPSRHREEFTHSLDDADLVDALMRAGGTDRSVLDDPELRAMFLPAIRCDYRAIETYRYRPGPPLECPVTLLVGDRDPAVTPDEAAAWASHGTGGFDLRVFPGGHFFLEDHREEITDLLCAKLRGAGL